MTAKIFRTSIILAAVFLFSFSTSSFASEASEAVNNFAFNAGKLIAANSESNFFFSPFSIMSAFGMAYAGASGDTAAEIEKALGVTKEIHSPLGELAKDFEQGGYMSSANRVWLKRGLKLRRSYSELLRKNYGSTACELDIKGETEQSRREINNWVSVKTNGKINDLIQQLDSETRMILTNAVYFRAEWLKKFMKPSTVKEKFYTDGENFMEVDMMKQRDDFSYVESDGVKVIMLPYEGRRFSMVIALPPEGKPEALKDLNAETFEGWINSMSKYDVDLWVPKFRTERRYELREIFEAMGIKRAFTNDADFSGMTLAERLKVDEIVHQTFIDVDEERTEAAAATAVMMLVGSAMPEKKPFAEFHADRPFMYFIRDNESGTILFMGYQSFRD